MKNLSIRLLVPCVVLGALTASAQPVTMSPLTTWGTGGWLAPGAGGYAYLGTGNNERGLAYGNGHVYLVSHASVSGTTANVRMLDPNTGADLGGLNNSGITGGTFLVNNIAVGGDGTIYVANLTTSTATSAFKIYSWATEASVPAVAYSGTGGISGARLGDDLAGIGSGASTLLVAGYNSSPSVAGNNGFAVISPSSASATAVGFSGTPPNAGDFRLGLTMSDSSHVLGSAGSSLYSYASFSGAAGTLVARPAIPDPAGATADRLLGYTTIAGRAILAVGSVGDSHVSIYDVTDPTNPIWLASGNNTTGSLTANGNGTGEIAWGPNVVNGDGTTSADLYTISSNQGIQAFVVTVPEPSAIAMAGLGLALLAMCRGKRRIDR
ncbi:MAG: hypothetical protein C5B50_26080 [Verrucomicrobia bacterium]|nr:MAG: hypothetical protein C5B50_26080 [Verrucomicrobiota bacterium]